MKEKSKMDSAGLLPRYEYRCFGQDFSEAAYRLSRLSSPVPESLWRRTSREVYLASRCNDHHNIKIRNGTLDIKSLVDTVDGLEQWRPTLKIAFPVDADILRNDVLSLLGLSDLQVSGDSCSEQELLLLLGSVSDAHCARLDKVRQGYQVDSTICEVVTVLINGARLSSICIESTQIADVKETLCQANLAGVENINYLQAIKRVIGLIDKPFAN